MFIAVFGQIGDAINQLGIRRQCARLTSACSKLYYHLKGENLQNLRFLGGIEKPFVETP